MNSSLLNLASLELALRVVAVAQFAVAILNLFLIRIMKWKPDLERAPLIIREVFRIHVVFISITLSIFAALTWRFAYEIARASSPLTIWLAVAIGSFWLVRSAMQWLHYSASHWRGDARGAVIDWALVLGYGAMATDDLWDACCHSPRVRPSQCWAGRRPGKRASSLS